MHASLCSKLLHQPKIHTWGRLTAAQIAQQQVVAGSRPLYAESVHRLFARKPRGLRKNDGSLLVAHERLVGCGWLAVSSPHCFAALSAWGPAVCAIIKLTQLPAARISRMCFHKNWIWGPLGSINIIFGPLHIFDTSFVVLKNWIWGPLGPYRHSFRTYLQNVISQKLNLRSARYRKHHFWSSSLFWYEFCSSQKLNLRSAWSYSDHKNWIWGPLGSIVIMFDPLYIS